MDTGTVIFFVVCLTVCLIVGYLAGYFSCSALIMSDAEGRDRGDG